MVLNKKNLILQKGDTYKLKLKNAPKKIKWSTNKKKVATVSNKGVVTAKGNGTAKVTAQIGKKKYVCTVKVKTAPQASVVPQNTQVPAPATLAPTMAPTATPSVEPTIDTTIVLKPTPSTDPAWQTAKCSGSAEDFTSFFDVKTSSYVVGDSEIAKGSLDLVKYESSTLGTTREAYVYTPAGYSPYKTYPVLYVLHGLGCDGGQWKGLSAKTIMDNMIGRGEVIPFVAVFPSITPLSGSDFADNVKAFSLFENEFKKDLEPYVYANYSVSHEREYTGICGLSMGGMESLYMGFSHLDHFNYIGAFSPAPTLDTSLLTLSGSKYVPAQVMICNGDKDGTVQDTPKEYHQKLTDNNVDHIWYMYPGGDHEGKVWKNGLINFLKQIL